MYKQANTTAQAASHYDDNVKNTSDDQRTLEARALLKCARRMQDLQEKWNDADLDHAAIDDVLTTNRKLWTLFYDTALENPEGNRPNDLRSNIVNLANFIFKRSIDMMASPTREKLDILITINREIAAGLAQQAAAQGEGVNSVKAEASASREPLEISA